LELNNDNTYNCLKKEKYYFKNYYIVPIRRKDIQLIRKWRNEQIDILRQRKKLTEKEQTNYYNKIIKKTFTEKEPDIIIFSYLLDDVCIGYGGLTNIDWISKKAEISFIVDTTRYSNSEIYQKDFQCFLNIITQLSFDELKLNRLFTETYDVRGLHIKILESVGFELESRIKQHVNIKDKFVDSIIHGYIRKQYIEKQKNFH